jgi:adenylylsulfate reductase subunit A
MSKYHPAGVRAPRFRLVEAVMKEISEGRGPVYVDCRHLLACEMTHLKKTLGYDKDTLPDFIEQKGIDLAKEPLEIMPSEGMQGGSSEVNSSGIMIDEKTASTVPGLFAAGDCSDQMRCVHVCTTGGYLAGKMAAEYAKTFAKGPKVKMSQARQLKEKTFAPLQASGTTPHRQLEDTMRNYHELTRVLETEQIWLVAKMMCTASLARKETRFGVYHHRTDYPETKPEYDGQIMLWKTEQGIKTEFKKLNYDVIPPL